MNFEKITTYDVQNHVVIQEELIYDKIFCNDDLPDRLDHSLETDSTYKLSDRQQYVFSTMGHGLYVMYPNGFASEIRDKKALLHQADLIKFLSGPNSTGRGVYIVENMLLHRSYFSSEAFKVALTNRFKAINFNINTTKQTAKLIDIVNAMTRYGQYVNPLVKFRLITFIPENIIAEHMRVYNPATGLLIGYGTINELIVHPCNTKYIEKLKEASSTVKNFVEIDIVDNTTDKEYWMKIGNQAVHLVPERDYRRRESCYVSISLNEKMMYTDSCSLQEAAKMLGIYNTKEEAEYNGNKDNIIKEMEYKIKFDNLQNETLKLNQDIIKLRNDNDKLAIEKQKLALEYKRLLFDFDKLKYDKDKLDIDKFKSEIDYDLAKERYKLELVKLLAEVRHMNDKFTLFRYNAIFDLIKKKMEYDNAEKISENKINYEEFKSTREVISDVQDAVSTTLSLGKMIGSLI